MSIIAANSNLGDLLSDDITIYRAFAYESYRRKKSKPPHEVRYYAYLLREDDSADGLSVGRTPRDAVKDLNPNYGYCSILVGDIHTLGFNLEVRSDLTDPKHAFICNLPLRTISDILADQAIFIARQLAKKSYCDVATTYVPNGN